MSVIIISPYSDNFKGYMSKRLYYIDLRENQRGRFLKISLVVTDEKKFIAIPGEYLVEFRDKFAQLLDKHSSGEAVTSTSSDLPPSKSFSVDRKTFYFDVERNERGVYTKVTEVCNM